MRDESPSEEKSEEDHRIDLLNEIALSHRPYHSLICRSGALVLGNIRPFVRGLAFFSTTQKFAHFKKSKKIENERMSLLK